MKSLNSNSVKVLSILNWSITTLVGVVFFFFWWRVLPNLLYFHEQYQLFLYNSNYFYECIARPGGISDYIARFLTQFYYYPWTGVLILTIVFLLVQRLTWNIMVLFNPQKGSRPFWYFLSFLPAVIFWSFLCDKDFMLSGLISYQLILSITWLGLLIKHSKLQRFFFLLSMPVVFWLSGLGFWIPFILYITREFINYKEFTWIKAITWLGIGIITATLSVLITYNYFTHYPIWRMISGINAYRLPLFMPGLHIFRFLSLLIPLLLYSFLPFIKKQKNQIILSLLSATLIFSGAYFIIHKVLDTETEEYMAYDQCVRACNWNEIISMGTTKTPKTPYTVAYLNLALGKTGQLGNQMFHFFQNGTEGLIPEFTKHHVGALVSSEIYYHLGLVNIGQAHAFEAMESIPDQQKSVRIIQRLVETNMINRQYKVAEKYIHLLQETLFYADWANEALACIKDSMRFNTHSDWVYLRKIRTTNEFVYSPQEKDMMLGILYQHNDQNKMAFEYLMAFCLLNKNTNLFTKYFSVGRNLNYPEIPRHFQEALTLYWTQNHQPLQNIPWPINPVVKKDIINFAGNYSKLRGNAQNFLKANYSNTYWYYYNFNSPH